jgi:hypothetical protein
MPNIKLCGAVQQVREAGFLFITDSMRLEVDVLSRRYKKS